jgi:hypothetical protein
MSKKADARQLGNMKTPHNDLDENRSAQTEAERRMFSWLTEIQRKFITNKMT